MRFNLTESIEILSRTPSVFRGLLSGLSDEWIKNNEGGDTWSPYDIIGHLIHGEKTDWIPRAKIIVNKQADKVFEPFDRFAQFENSKGKSLEELLTEFEALRKVNIEALKSMQLTEELLNQTGIHPDLGEATLKQLLATWTIHDLSHINQMTRVMMQNYKEEVGPWKAYISLLE